MFRPKKKKTGERKTPVRWIDKPTHELITYAQDKIVNPYIRLRDNENYGKSISDNGRISDAGHYFSVGSCPSLRFNCQNIHGQSRSGNTFKSGDLINYRKGLIQRFGEDYFDELEFMHHRKGGLDRVNVMMIAITYKYLTKNKIWVFRDAEFQIVKDKMEWPKKF